MSRVRLSVEQYEAEISALVDPLEDVVDLEVRAAAGHTLARPVRARTDIPAFTNSAMDGYAVRAREAGTGAILEVVAEVLAGSGADPAFGPGSCVRIMTGAPVPTAADAVVPIEQATTLSPTTIRVDTPVAVGRHVRRAGEDVRDGDLVVGEGVRLDARSLSAVAAAGVDTVRCVRAPVVGVVSTGDELVAPGGTLERGQIFESNATFLTAAVERDGGQAVVGARVPDQPAALRATLDRQAETCDLILVSGGVSVGDADVTRLVLEAEGATFRHVAMQPGKPQGWALWGARRVPVIGLPGNPLSALVSYEMFVAPALARMQGRSTPGWTVARTTAAWSSPGGRRQIVPVVLDVDPDGYQIARPAHRRGSASHMVTATVEAQALGAVAEDVTTVQVGDIIAVRRLM